jgi:hypothetical protein
MFEYNYEDLNDVRQVSSTLAHVLVNYNGYDLLLLKLPPEYHYLLYTLAVNLWFASDAK